MNANNLAEQYLSIKEVQDKVGSFRDESCNAVRNRHAKLNELSEDQDSAARMAIQDAFDDGFFNGLVDGLTKGREVEQAIRLKQLPVILTIRSFFAASLMIPVSLMVVEFVSNPPLALVLSSCIVAAGFYLADRITTGVLSSLVGYLDRKNSKKNVVPPK